MRIRTHEPSLAVFLLFWVFVSLTFYRTSVSIFLPHNWVIVYIEPTIHRIFSASFWSVDKRLGIDLSATQNVNVGFLSLLFFNNRFHRSFTRIYNKSINVQCYYRSLFRQVGIYWTLWVKKKLKNFGWEEKHETEIIFFLIINYALWKAKVFSILYRNRYLWMAEKQHSAINFHTFFHL